MTPGFISSTLTTMAPALGNHLWQSTLFAIAMWLLTLFWRKNQAQARYWLWMAASLKFLVPFSLLVALGGRMATPRVPATTQTTFFFAMVQVTQPYTQQPSTLLPPASPTAVSSSRMDLLPVILAAVWLCGLLAVLLLWCFRWRRISGIIRQATPLQEGREAQALQRLQSKAGMKSRVSILLSRASVEPGIFGIFRPVLLWPEGISERLGDEHLEAILAHELWHVRRRDNLAATVHMAIEALFWFHPLVWWLGARLVEERERACDQEVLALGSQRQIYAESILKTCEFCVEAPLACISGVAGADLKQRIVHIMTQGLAEKLSLGRKVFLAAIGAVTLAGPVIFGLLHAPQVRAQSAQAASRSSSSFSYEVASIKPDKATDGLVRIQFTPNGFTAEGVSPKFLLGLAYNVKDFQLSGLPGWAESERYDIQAKMDDATAEALNRLPPNQRLEQRRLMLQSFLAERFNLKLTHSSREMPIYALVVAKGGPKLTPSKVTTEADLRRFANSAVAFSLAGMPVSGLADFLSMRLKRQVVDKTGLQGNYDITFHFAPPGNLADNGPDPAATSPDSSDPSIFTALQEQLGLKLESQKGPVEVLIIASIQKPIEN